jgi:hypothetical protein
MLLLAAYTYYYFPSLMREKGYGFFSLGAPRKPRRLPVSWLGGGESGAAPDVRIHERPPIIQIQRTQAGVGTIVPVAAAKRQTPHYQPYPPAADFFHPPIILPISVACPHIISYFLSGKKPSLTLTRTNTFIFTNVISACSIRFRFSFRSVIDAARAMAVPISYRAVVVFAASVNRSLFGYDFRAV